MNNFEIVYGVDIQFTYFYSNSYTENPNLANPKKILLGTEYEFKNNEYAVVSNMPLKAPKNID